MHLPKKILTILFSILSIIGYGAFVFAAPNFPTTPVGGYLPGTELDPVCAPNDPNCFVQTIVATTASYYSWMGLGAGQNGGSTDNTVFIGINAGDGASHASYSNFIGTSAGLNATNATNSNFFGQLAGCGATNASNANFFGQRAGCGATDANNANFFGNSAGENAIDGRFSTFFGDNSGRDAAGAYQSNFLGAYSGFEAINASNANFLGYQAGYRAYGAENSFFAGNQAGYNASNTADFLGATSNPYGFAGNSVFIGKQAGYDASSAAISTFIGNESGYEATNALASVFVGYQSGYQANNARGSVFIGNFAGKDAINAGGSLILGNFAGNGATNAGEAVLLGTNTGLNAVNAPQATFVGGAAGKNATNAGYSTFFGNFAGGFATNAVLSTFMGHYAGESAINAARSIFIGKQAGSGDTVNNPLMVITVSGTSGSFLRDDSITGSVTNCYTNIVAINGNDLITNGDTNNCTYQIGEIITGTDSGTTATITAVTGGEGASILIGNNTNTNGFSNSIALGSYAKNTATNQFMIGSLSSPIDRMDFNGGTGVTCSIIVGTGMSCSSDERLKTNITDLNTNILDSLTKVRTVTYNWKANPTGNSMIGFLAQDLEQYFPQLVATNETGQKSVNYANMTPVLVQGLRELNLKLSAIESVSETINPTFLVNLRNWFASSGNGIMELFAKKVSTDQLCIGATCINESDLQSFKTWQQSSGGIPVITTPTPPPTEPEIINETPLSEDEDVPLVITNPESTPEPVVDSGNDPIPSPEPVSTPVDVVPE